VGLGCGPRAAAPTPAAPRDAVRIEVERAEDAERARHHDQARAHYEAAIGLAVDPASRRFAHREYADTLMSWGELDGATRELRAVTAATPDDAAAWHDLGILLHQRRDDAGAIAALERAQQLAPRDLRPRVALAALRWSLGDRPGAVRAYQELLELDPPERLRAKIVWALGQLGAAP
jgi:Flp pilus assembly protein TadD